MMYELIIFLAGAFLGALFSFVLLICCMVGDENEED